MNIKIDTKEKFTVINIQETILTANMTAQIENLAIYKTKNVPHLIVQMQQVLDIDTAAAQVMYKIQQDFYASNFSFVVCQLQPNVIAVFEKQDLLDTMNITPTESEAWDIVQMEEIERELMRDFD
ncbi:MAG: STAS domain-containing protein [Ferruginibacter sp.]|nr:STAS domain-containing protein [Ferruginibacter sp.]